jgi:hypothetical protein
MQTISVSLPRSGSLHDYVVLPIVPEVMAVEKSRPDFGDRAEWRCVFAYQEDLVVRIRHAESDVAGGEVVEVRIRPPERNLEHVMHLCKGKARRHAHLTPDRGFNVSERNLELKAIEARKRQVVHWAMVSVRARGRPAGARTRPLGSDHRPVDMSSTLQRSARPMTAKAGQAKIALASEWRALEGPHRGAARP